LASFQQSSSSPRGPVSESPGSASPRLGRWSWLDLFLYRVIFLGLAVAASYHFRPFGLSVRYSVVFGLALGLGGVLLEMRLRHSSLTRLIGAVVGAIAGILCASLISLVIGNASIELRTQSFLQVILLMVMTYLGMIIGANKGDLLNLQALGGLFGAERSARRHYKILDTSVIIDGRIADICEAGFMDGIILLPQFVLRELQLVADSPDALKRNRGRRGLDMLQRIQKISNWPSATKASSSPTTSTSTSSPSSRASTSSTSTSSPMPSGPSSSPARPCASLFSRKGRNRIRALRTWTTAPWWWWKTPAA
jgi:hypothetical protein